MRNYLKLLTAFVLTALATTTIGAPTDFEIIKIRVVEALIQPGVNDTGIELLIE